MSLAIDRTEHQESPEERWDCYYHDLLLHSSSHRDMYWHKDNWWWPIGERVDASFDLFHGGSAGVVEQMKYYDLQLPDGRLLEDLRRLPDLPILALMQSVYVGSGTDEDWLEDYIAYNLNLVTVDQRGSSG